MGTSRVRTTAWVLYYVAAGVLGVFAAAKVFDVDGFEESLGTWSVLPAWLTPLLAIAIPLLELLVVAWMVIAKTKRWPAVGYLVLIGGFTAGYAAELVLGNTPNCDCSGVVGPYIEKIGVLTDVLLRNPILMAMVVPAVVLNLKGKRGGYFERKAQGDKGSADQRS